MAFDARYLTCVGQIGNEMPNLWLYKTTDAAAAVDSAGYFPVGYGIKLGDVIMRVTVDSLTAPTAASAAGFHIVNSVSATAIDVADALALTTTDTD